MKKQNNRSRLEKLILGLYLGKDKAIQAVGDELISDPDIINRLVTYVARNRGGGHTTRTSTLLIALMTGLGHNTGRPDANGGSQQFPSALSLSANDT